MQYRAFWKRAYSFEVLRLLADDKSLRHRVHPARRHRRDSSHAGLKVAVVTGAGRGIGLSIAKITGKQGASIVVNDLDAGIAEQAAASVRQDGAEAISVPGSVADDGFGEHLAQETSDKFGRADILVNNAGMLWDGMLHTMNDAQWQKVLDVHATAPFRIIRAFAPLLRDAGKQEAPTMLQYKTEASSTSPPPPDCTATWARRTTRWPRPVYSASRKRSPRSGGPSAYDVIV